MKRMKPILLLGLIASISISSVALAGPMPLNCIGFKSVSHWNTTISITNNCGQPIDLKNAIFTFSTIPALNVGSSFSAWDFSQGGLDYPSHSTIVKSGNEYSYNYQYAVGSQWWKPNSTLAAGATTAITFSNGESLQSVQLTNPVLYVGPMTPVQTASVVLTPKQALPSSAQVVITGSDYSTTIPGSLMQSSSPYIVSQVPYGSYTVSASFTQDGTIYPIAASPSSFNLASATQAVSLAYTSPLATPVLTIQALAQPQGQNLPSTIAVHVEDQTNSANSISTNVSWGGSTKLNLVSGDSYVFSADSQIGTGYVYNFSFTPVSSWKASSAGLNVSLNYSSAPVPTYSVDYTVSGLPDGASTHLIFTSSSGSAVDIAGVVNGSNSVKLQSGVYTVMAQHYIDATQKLDYIPSVSPAQISVPVASTATVQVAYKSQALASKVFGAYWAGWSGYQFDLQKDYSDIPLNQMYLAFADYHNGKIDTSVSGYYAVVPAAGNQIQPTYQNWTTYAYKNPNVLMMMSVGGATFSQMWNVLKSAKQADIDALAEAIVNVMNTEFPVYAADPNNPQVAFANANKLLGYVNIDGVDLDVELGGARLDKSYTQGLVKLINKIHQLAPNKLITVATFSVGADPIGQCTVAGSVHCGEAIDLLKQAGANINYVNVMAYDAGQNFVQGSKPLYRTAMQNYVSLVGSKAVLGLDVQAQWDPYQYFSQSDDSIVAAASWAYAQPNIGGTFLWEIGDSSHVPRNLLLKIANTMH